MSGEKPTTAFVLMLLSGIILLLFAILALAIGALLRAEIPLEESMPLPTGMGFLTAFAIGTVMIIVGAIALLIGLLMIVAAFKIRSGEPGKVKTWSIIGIILSIVSLITVGGGFYLSFVLGLIGGILGLTWKPPEKPVAQEQTPLPPPVLSLIHI
mgnify:CR=1 FL=1